MTMIMILMVVGFITYAIIPNYYSRNFSKNVIKNIDGDKEIALTFDDGPDSRYTPDLLDLLKKHQVQATFFLVAKKALKERSIVERMIREGHSIALHSLSHKSAWLSLPWQTTMDFEKSLNIFKTLGYQLKYFRPPWGTFNLVTEYIASKYHLKTVLWTINAQDWSSRTTVNDIKNRILNTVKPGDIIVLHDSNGAEDAPLRTIEALKEILPKLKKAGYRFVTIDEKIGGVNHARDY